MAEVSLSSSGAEAARAQQRSVEAEEHSGNLLRLTKALFVSTPTWYGFALLDVLAARSGPAAPPLMWFLGLRFALTPMVVAAWWLLLRANKPPGPRLLRAMDAAVHCTAAYLIAIMTTRYGGIASSYVPGIILVLVARSAFSAEPWRRGLAPNMAIASAFPIVMLIASRFSPMIAAQLEDPAARAAAVHYIFFLYGTVILVLAGNQAAWSVRRRLYETRSIGRYRLRARIGVGGMGEVWAAYHSGLQRDVALKILRPEVANDPNAIARFEREVKATTELSHPNTIRVFDYGVTRDGVWYYAMELLEGRTLAQLLREEGALPPARAVHLVSQAARSLAEAHARGIIHRDVKPANVFVTTAGGERDFVKMLDFGIARRLEGDGGADITQAGEVAGTPKYTAPEIVIGQRATPASDVYGLGVVLYTLLVGAPPFEGEESAIYVAHVTEAPNAPSIKAAGVSSELDRVVLRCLAKDPASRFANAAELADAIQDLGLVWQPGRTVHDPEQVTQSRLSAAS